MAVWNLSQLMLLPALVSISAMISGCGGSPGPQTEISQPQSTDSTSQAGGDEVLRSDTLLVLPLDTADFPVGIQWEGVFDDGAHWRDKNGDNYLVISEVFQGELSDRSLVAKFFAHSHNYASGKLDEYWAIKEFNQDYFTFPTYSEGTLEITDLDHDGIAESSFIYRIEVDGTAPAKVKLLMHVKGKKYAIRGQLAGMDYDMGKVEEKHIDPAFNEIAPIFRDFASQKWDAYEREYYKGWPEGVD
ncbi:MAG: hypothetical protein U0176_22905 [Bacteroidia bacterium]